MLRQGPTPAKGAATRAGFAAKKAFVRNQGLHGDAERAKRTARESTSKRPKMAQTTVSAAEAALENQRIGGLQLRVAALCTLVQICDGYDLNSVAWAVPSLIKAWHLPPPMFTTAFLWSSIGILVGALSAGPIGDRFGRRPLLLASLTIFGIGLAAERDGRLDRHAEPLALLHRDRHRRWLFRRRRADRRLRAAPPARDDDHGDVHRRAPGRLFGRPDRRGAARALRLAGDLRPGRRVPAGPGAGAGAVAAGIAAIPGQEAEPVTEPGRVASPPRHRADPGSCGRCRAGKSGQAAVQRGLCPADRAAVDHLLLQPDEPVPVRLLDADGTST